MCRNNRHIYRSRCAPRNKLHGFHLLNIFKTKYKAGSKGVFGNLSDFLDEFLGNHFPFLYRFFTHLTVLAYLVTCPTPVLKKLVHPVSSTKPGLVVKKKLETDYRLQGELRLCNPPSLVGYPPERTHDPSDLTNHQPTGCFLLVYCSLQGPQVA